MLNDSNETGRPVALITGASGGLGQELCLDLARRGYSVAVHYHSRQAQAVKIVSAITSAGGQAIAYGADVGNSHEVRRLFSDITSRQRRLDVLIHCAGNIAPAFLVKMKESDFDAVIQTHLRGAFLCTQAAARMMMKPRRGSIVYIGSILGLRGVVGECNYAAAKAGLMGLGKSAAKELGRWNICVNVVLPGYMLTSMGRRAPQEYVDAAKNENVLNRWTDPKDSARRIVDLCESPWISGQVLNLDARIP
jgi:3-oxoacyl-[acyl-carrier protein] reductase